MLQNFSMIAILNVRKGAFAAITAKIVAQIITYEMAPISYFMSHPAQQAVPVFQQPSSEQKCPISKLP
jgi:hypothetical protein